MYVVLLVCVETCSIKQVHHEAICELAVKTIQSPSQE